MHSIRVALVVWVLNLGLIPGLPGAEPLASSADLPRVPPVEPGEVQATFQVKEGFRMELVAAEPLVLDPIAMSFDEDGRLYVVEMRDYSERRPERLGRVRMLTDTDGDGRFDRSTVYVSDLPWPTAVFAYGGGVFVGATPDLLYCRDEDGDGTAEVREAMFTGFASDFAPYATNRLNVQAMLNSLHWGLDHRVHGSASLSGGKVRRVDSPFTRSWRARAQAGLEAPSEPVDLRGRDFSFDPRTLDFRAEHGGAQHGLSFDSEGRKFVCSNSDHIQMVMYTPGQAAGATGLPLPPPRLSIAADGPAAEVFRISPEEPWRVLRTRWRVAGLVPGPIEGGGRASGYFTSATGTTIYRGDAFPEEYRENAFIADCGSNLIHRKRLRPEGVALVAERPADEARREFVASRDVWFRPVQFANGPDGCLYVADMYREVIEHPWSLPPGIKQHLDLNSGSDRGRIYRIAPDGFRGARRVALGSASAAELVATLEHRNGWHRDTAARLLHERQDPAALPLLARLLATTSFPVAKLHALHALDALGALAPAQILVALRDPATPVREHAVSLAVSRLQRRGTPQPDLDAAVRALASDPSPRVAYAVAFALRSMDAEPRVSALETIARTHGADRWVRAALLSSVDVGALPLFVTLARDADFARTAAGEELLAALARAIGARNEDGEGSRALQAMRGLDLESDRGLRLLSALAEGLASAGGSLAQAGQAGLLDAAYRRARETAARSGAPDALRADAVQLLALADLELAGPALAGLLDPVIPEAVQMAAIRGLGRFAEPRAGRLLLGAWPHLTPRLREAVVAMLIRRPAQLELILDALETGEVQAAELSAAHVAQIRAHGQPAIRERAARLLAVERSSTRGEVLQAFLPALDLEGDAAKGKAIYSERCASCHRLGGEGYVLGPDLVSVKAAGKEKLLIGILDPNREVPPDRLGYTVETRSGETHTGLLAAESEAAVLLRAANGLETTIPRAQIAQIRASSLSIMPEGLEAGLSPRDMADLLAYLVEAE